MFPLRCRVQQYAWGKPGAVSAVAKLQAACGASVSETEPYAEFWMGTHPNGPSQVVLPSGLESLGAFLQTHEAEAGLTVNPDDKSPLPFLLKVLSVNQALSIQAHPDRALAGRLHEARPDVYKDPNHKPEMCIALTRFEALCQFRPLASIAGFLRSVPELRAVVGEAAAAGLERAAAAAACERAAAAGACEGANERASAAGAAGAASGEGASASAALAAVFRAFVACEPARLAPQLDALLARLDAIPGVESRPIDGDDPSALVLRLARQYPGDNGIFAPYLLNVVVLEPGEGVFLAANEPHAYLAGDCVECMAASDNVVRAGLTPKLKDVATLCGMLSYAAGRPAVTCGESVGAAAGCEGRLYRPPVPEFEVERLVAAAGATICLSGSDRSSCSVVLCVSGSATAQDGASTGLAAGCAYLQAASSGPLEFRAGEGGATVFRAQVNRELWGKA